MSRIHQIDQRTVRTCGRRNRRGFTLVEMMLVLAVLIVAAAVTWPAVSRLYHEHHLRQSADQIRIRMTAARIHAVESGISYQFRFEPGGSRYVIVPTEQDVEGAQVWKESGKLASGVLFDEVTGANSAPPLAPDALNGLPDVSELGSVSWSPPVMFFPDGTSEEVSLRVLNTQEKHVTMHVRQLTGGVTVSRVKRGGNE